MKKRLVSLFVENVPREEVPAWCCEIFVTVTNLTGVPPQKCVSGISPCGLFAIPNLSHIAELAEVGDSVTRTELMHAYDLVEQGYTLWFGGNCPVHREALVGHVMAGGYVGERTLAKHLAWKDSPIIAYKIVEPAKPKHIDHPCKFALPDVVTITGQYVERDGDKIFFTPDEVVSVAKQIHTGDVLTTKHGTTVEVLYIGKTNVFLHDSSSGEEFSASHLDVLEFYDY